MKKVLCCALSVALLLVALPGAYAAGETPHIVQIVAGGYHSLALLSDGSLYAWGHNGFGQLGDGTNEKRNVPTLVGTGFTKVAVGYQHTLALKGDELWTWGYNYDGELGDGTYENKNTPTLIGTGYIDIAGGGVHSLAIAADGSLYAWGNYEDIQQGGEDDEPILPNNTPTLIGTGYTSVAAGLYHSLALKGDELYTWGRNVEGQLGNGTDRSERLPISIGTGYTQIAAGLFHSLALKGDELYAWGLNDSDQLGDMTYEDHYVPTYICKGYEFISAGGRQSMALCGDELYAWGLDATDTGEMAFDMAFDIDEDLGEEGEEAEADEDEEVTHLLIGTGYTAVAAGFRHVLAIRDGALYAWGFNNAGQLGDGTEEETYEPTLVLIG